CRCATPHPTHIRPIAGGCLGESMRKLLLLKQSRAGAANHATASPDKTENLGVELKVSVRAGADILTSFNERWRIGDHQIKAMFDELAEIFEHIGAQDLAGSTLSLDVELGLSKSALGGIDCRDLDLETCILENASQLRAPLSHVTAKVQNAQALALDRPNPPE